MNVRKTQKSNAASSATTSSEGTDAPVAMVTTWTRTTTLALVQITLFWLLLLLLILEENRQKQWRQVKEDGTKLKHEVSTRESRSRSQEVEKEKDEKRSMRTIVLMSIQMMITIHLSSTQWVVARICQDRTKATYPVPPGLVCMRRTQTAGTPCQWRPTCSWSCTSLGCLMWSRALMVNA